MSKSIKRYSAKWWLLSAGAIVMSLWIFIVFVFLIIGRELLLFGSLLNPFNKGKNVPDWVQKWARKLQGFYEDYLQL